MRIRKAHFIMGMLLAGLLAPGCGDDDSQQNNNTVDAGVDAASDAATLSSVTVQIVEYSTEDGTLVPVEGATVAFDAPGGARNEVVTGTDGIATVDEVDWSLGTGAVTVHKDDYQIISGVNITAADYAEWQGLSDTGVARITLIPFEADTPAMTTVTGTATALADAGAHNVVLFPFGAPGAAGSGPATDPVDYTVETGAPYTLVGIEALDGVLPSGTGYFVDIYKAMIMEHAAQSSATALEELDFAAYEVTPSRAEGQMVLPTRATSPLRSGWPNVWVMDWGSTLGSNTGWAEEIDFSADGNAFDVSYVWVEPPLLENPFTFCRVMNGQTGDTSIVFKPGYPEAGPLDPPLLDVPRWVTPSNPSLVYPLGSTMEWELFDEGVHVVFEIRRDDRLIWAVDAFSDATTVTVPAPPSSVNVASFLGTGNLLGRLLIYQLDAAGKYYERIATSRSIYVRP